MARLRVGGAWHAVAIAVVGLVLAIGGAASTDRVTTPPPTTSPLLTHCQDLLDAFMVVFPFPNTPEHESASAAYKACLSEHWTTLAPLAGGLARVAGSTNALVETRWGVMLVSMYDVYIGRSLFLYGEWSPGEGDLYGFLINPGDFVADVGANIGAFTLAFSELVGPSGFVFAFEPEPTISNMLAANLALNGRTNVLVVREGLAEASGGVSVRYNEFDALNNYGSSVVRTDRRSNTRVAPLDAWNLDRLDFVKIDVQGFEERVVRGAADTLRRLQPMLYIENEDKDDRAVVNFLDTLGYACIWSVFPLYRRNNHRDYARNVFGEVASVNMLCAVPSKHDLDLSSGTRVGTTFEPRVSLHKRDL